MIKKITRVTKGFSISKSFWITYISFNYSHFFLHDSLLTHLTVPNKNLVYIVWEKDSENRKHKDKSRDFSAFCKAFKGSVSGKRQEKSFGSLLRLRRSCFFHSFFPFTSASVMRTFLILKLFPSSPICCRFSLNTVFTGLCYSSYHPWTDWTDQEFKTNPELEGLKDRLNMMSQWIWKWIYTMKNVTKPVIKIAFTQVNNCHVCFNRCKCFYYANSNSRQVVHCMKWDYKILSLN